MPPASFIYFNPGNEEAIGISRRNYTPAFSVRRMAMELADGIGLPPALVRRFRRCRLGRITGRRGLRGAHEATVPPFAPPGLSAPALFRAAFRGSALGTGAERVGPVRAHGQAIPPAPRDTRVDGGLSPVGYPCGRRPIAGWPAGRRHARRWPPSMRYCLRRNCPRFPSLPHRSTPSAIGSTVSRGHSC